MQTLGSLRQLLVWEVVRWWSFHAVSARLAAHSSEASSLLSPNEAKPESERKPKSSSQEHPRAVHDQEKPPKKKLP